MPFFLLLPRLIAPFFEMSLPHSKKVGERGSANNRAGLVQVDWWVAELYEAGSGDFQSPDRLPSVLRFLRRIAGDRFVVVSAGTEKAEVRPEAIQAMRRHGIDISWHTSMDLLTLQGVFRTFDTAGEFGEW